MAMMLGVPSKLLREFINKKVTVESNTGEKYVGNLEEAEENMSVSLSDVNVTFADGSQAPKENVYIRGSKIRLINLPSSAKDSLKTLTASRGFRGGRGGRGGFGGARRGGFGTGGYGGKPSYDRRRY